MVDKMFNQCKSKGCHNPVLKGKYCEQCTQKRKEKTKKILACAGGTLIAGCVALKKIGIKKAPKIAAKVVKMVFKI